MYFFYLLKNSRIFAVFLNFQGAKNGTLALYKFTTSNNVEVATGGVLKNFAKLSTKHLATVSFLIKVQVLGLELY